MALKNHKKTITRIFILLVVMTLICMGVFACTNYLEQQSKAFVDMSKVQLMTLMYSRWKRAYTSKQAAPMQTARWTAMQTAPMKK